MFWPEPALSKQQLLIKSKQRILLHHSSFQDKDISHILTLCLQQGCVGGGGKRDMSKATH